jgi:hypothetical protein
MNDKILYAINDNKVTRENRSDVEEFCKLEKLHKQGKLSESKKKRRSRIMVRLMKGGILKQMSRKALEEAAQIMYDNFPWHKKVKLRFQFLYRKFKNWFSSKFLKNRKVK